MLQTLLIAFREGLEALLIVAIAALYLRRVGRESLIGGIRAGVITALVISAVVGAILAQVGAISPAWEGLMAWIAAAAVLSCTFHMLRMGKRMKQHIDGRLGEATQQEGRAGWWAVFAFSVFMVGREGIETATMIASLAVSGDLAHLAIGGAIGFALAAWIAWLWTRHGQKVNLGRFFQVTAVFMVVLAIQLIVGGFHEFTEAGLVPGLDNAWWHEHTESIAEGAIAQAISIAMVALPSIWLIGAFWKDRASVVTASAGSGSR
jgi:high-affinity iron transporter